MIEIILGFAIAIGYAIRLRKSVLARLQTSNVRLPIVCAEVALLAIVALQLLHLDPSRYHGPTALRYVGLVLALFGATLSSVARLVLRENYVPSAAAQPSRRLVVAWPYSMVRHPAYLGNAVTLLGFELAVESGGVILVLVYLTVNVGQANREEVMMASAHGEAWSDYTKRVRFKLLPWLFAMSILADVSAAKPPCDRGRTTMACLKSSAAV
ncbi:MAG TPA: isoprenylcysteine carboxylmethyltransferase family protein [Thermoanaerobaculia bacterium]|jgi:protein-S-isoprenylcysteine O-methyltransferase Ste14|nr:isoprenylcysteine carboxylmethyltransferase family protein [Thermoanaerobaculia bacterium]